MPSALETLVKILKLERDQGYKNTAMIGGLGAYRERWAEDAHQQARIEMHHLLVDDIAQLMASYDDLESNEERHEVISYMLDRIMMRITEPRADFKPSYSWESNTNDSPASAGEAQPVRDEAAAEQPEKPGKRGRSKPERKSTKPKKTPKQSDSQSAKRQSKGGDDDHTPLEAEFEAPYEGKQQWDLPPEPRLERPPRPRRRDIDPEEAADLMRGLEAPVTKISGVGDKMAETLGRLGMYQIQDMLFNVPNRYDDYTRMPPIARLEPEQTVTVIGTVRGAHVRVGRSGSKDFAFHLDDGSASLMVIFFRQGWMQSKVRDGYQLVLSGKVSIYRDQLQMSNPEWERLDAENLKARGIVPVYRLTKGLNARRLRNLMQNAVDFWADRLPDYVPLPVLERNDLPDIGWMLKNLHFPDGFDHLTHAKRRYDFDRLLLWQMALLNYRRERQSVVAAPLDVADDWLDTFLEAVFPYPLTGAQQRTLHDIRTDMATDLPMNRLIQGDVGSGKTAVAISAMAVAFANDKQAAMMAPTSILAEQHYRSVSEALARTPGTLKPKVALLTGAMPKAERDAVLAGLADGSIDVVIGTHALIQGGVDFFDLGLVVIDEQHRFGVEQRGALRGKGTNPHLLVMTATPIPRSLAMTLYADLDVSVIDEMPPGRTPIRTTIRTPFEREHCYDFIKAQLDVGRQAFIVYPLVEASDKVEAKSATEAFEELSQVFYQYRVGLLHGKMKPDEKDEAMHAFADGQFDVLVTTSVAEVGVNIPNASVMMIEGANRFGLSQLHQFRGRVGRGEHPGYCILIPDNLTEQAEKRLAAMEETTDGFKLAEMDMQLRKWGDLLGTRQSGSSRLALDGELDPEMVALAQREARTIYAEDPDLDLPEHELLRQRVAQLKDPSSDAS